MAWTATYTLHSRVFSSVLNASSVVLRGIGILFIALGVFFLLPSLWWLLTDLVSMQFDPVCLIRAGIGAACLVIGLRWFRNYKTSRSVLPRVPLAGISDTLLEFSFEDDAFFVQENGRPSSYRYHVLSAVWEDVDRYYLFISGKMHFILQKAALSCGSPDDFSAFLAQKIGKAVEYIK